MLLATLSDDKTHDIVEAAGSIAKELGTTTARVALAWVQAQAGVTSTIIGARTLAQLDDNLGALEVKLAPEHLKRLSDLSVPNLGFPMGFLRFAGSFAYGGTNIHGTDYPPVPNAPKNDAERY